MNVLSRARIDMREYKNVQELKSVQELKACENRRRGIELG
jgi:hypothetical protein